MGRPHFVMITDRILKNQNKTSKSYGKNAFLCCFSSFIISSNDYFTIEKDRKFDKVGIQLFYRKFVTFKLIENRIC